MYDSGLNTTTGDSGPVFLKYLQVIRRRKGVVVLCLIGVMIPVALFSKFATPVYEAEATIIYEEPTDTMFALDVGQPFYNKSSLVNLSQQLKSRYLAHRVTKSLPDDIVRTFEIARFKSESFSREEYISDRLRKNVSVEMVRGSDILIFRVQANDPIAAKVIANTYVQEIIDWKLQKKREDISNIRDLVEEQLQIFQGQLGEAEETLRAFKEENLMVSLSDASQEMLNRMIEAEVLYNATSAERRSLEQRRRIIEQKIRELAPAINVAPSALALQLQERLLDVERRYSSNLINGIAENTSEMVSLKERIKQLKQELVQELLTRAQQENLIDPLSQARNLLRESITLVVDYETLKAKEQELQRTIAKYEAELHKLPKQELMFARHIRARDVNNKIYSMLLEKREEVRITEAGKVGDIHVIDPAETPIAPIRPNKVQDLMLGIILGLVCGIGIAFLQEYIDSSLKSPEEVEKLLNVPVLTSIPHVDLNGELHPPKEKESHHRRQFEKIGYDLRSHENVLDACRRLQINFAFVTAADAVKTILLTSPGPGDGKSLTACNVAQMFALSGKQTLLLDCDFRRPVIHRLFDVQREPGLTNFLIQPPVSAKPVEDFMKQTQYKHLSVLPAGSTPPNPADMLMSQRMQVFLEEMKNRYDLIILDSPPVIPVADALILGSIVDAVCLVVRSEKTSRDMTLKVKKQLENSNAKIIGVVVNDIDFGSVYGYGYHDYFYHYADEHREKKSRNDRTEPTLLA